MFAQIEREASFGSWIFQLPLAYCCPLLILAILETWLDVQDSFATLGLEYVFVGVMGVTLAWFVLAVARESATEGRWVWILPTALEIFAVVWQLRLAGIMSVVHELFVPEAPLQGEGLWAITLLTLPSWGCCWYSATMAWRRRSAIATSGAANQA